MRLIDADKLFEKFRTTFPASEVFQILNQAPTVCDIDAIKAEIDYMIEQEQAFDSDNARAQIIALEWVKDTIGKYTEGNTK